MNKLKTVDSRINFLFIFVVFNGKIHKSFGDIFAKFWGLK